MLPHTGSRVIPITARAVSTISRNRSIRPVPTLYTPPDLTGACAATRNASATSPTYTRSRATSGFTSGGNAPSSPASASAVINRRGASYGPYTLNSRSVVTCTPDPAAIVHRCVAAAFVTA